MSRTQIKKDGIDGTSIAPTTTTDSPPKLDVVVEMKNVLGDARTRSTNKSHRDSSTDSRTDSGSQSQNADDGVPRKEEKVVVETGRDTESGEDEEWGSKNLVLRKMETLNARLEAVERSLALASSRTNTETKINVAPIGLSGFSHFVISVGLVLCGAASNSGGVVVVYGFFFGGLLQLIAGGLEVKQNGSLFGMWAFCIFGINAMANGLFAVFIKAGLVDQPSRESSLGRVIWLIVFVTMLMVLCLKLSWFLFATIITVWIALILEAIGIYYPAWDVASGSFFIISGSLALWLAFTEVFNKYWQAEILPSWPIRQKPHEKH